MERKKEKKDKAKEDKGIKLDEGRLTFEQIRLLLKNLPVDITFVDENDKVCFYSASKDRIFARSPAIIGKSVQNCHPQKSVHIVDKIVKSFKEKKKDKAEFWIQQGELFIYIRYFPVYDENGDYRGVVEVSQEVSGIRSLKGERRILDW
ncbi:MAG: PAS domain-containing protein [Candidatus Aminicenantes bacterium]